MLAYIKKPETAELIALIKHGRDIIRLLTIAPEMFSGDQIKLLLDSGITIAAGHSNATYQEASVAFNQGIKLVTHLYNAMSPLQHRAPGLVGATFEHDDVYAPIILDGQHCDYAAARIAYKLKKDKFFLISDATFLGRKVANFNWDNFDAHLENGFYRNKDGNLAGATISMSEAVQNAYHHLNVTADEAIKMATSRVAAAIDVENQLGKIKAGFPASFVRFNDDLSEIETLDLRKV